VKQRIKLRGDRKENMVKKRLCLVIPSLQAGGMERVMAELSGYFAKNEDIEQHLVLYGIEREIFYIIPGSVIIHTPDFTFKSKRRLFYTLKTLNYLRKIVKGINPDSILSFGEYWNSFVLISLLGLSFPVYISDRCSPEKKFSAFHTLLRQLLYPRATGIIAQTDKAKELYSKQFRHSDIRVIGNPIRNISGANDKDRENIILMVGRLITSKHQDRLIRLFLELAIPGWRLFLIGYDPLNQRNLERLHTLINQNNAQDKVMLLGKQVNVDSFYQRSKVFAFTSSSEGFPNVVGEALSAGLPVVSYNCIAGPSDLIINGENGFLVPTLDDVQFKQKIRLLVDNEDLRNRMSVNARISMKIFSVELIGKKYLDFILA
jgi:GalNAc-alpha-(1->4)-GalNAc-alpha-(1->3)-diNAcBac-PP-undecaprenol alpha-1,4-N-acetyl-D-galactosaminyltransferase